MIIDTETIGLGKRFIYDVGFMVLDESFEIVEQHQFLLKQVYDNKELFATAYYNEKKPKYSYLLRKGKAKKVYVGYATQFIKRIIKKYNITKVYAYNASFDKGAFIFTTNFYKVINPFENLEFIDIMKLAKVLHERLEYIEFATQNNFITPKGKIKRTAETTYCFLIKDKDFIEKHISIPDCVIELYILKATV